MAREAMTSASLSHDQLNVLWAKSSPRHPLWKHLLDTAAVSLALPNPIASFGWSVEQTALLVGLHDIGKADSCFQHQVSELSSELTEAGFPVTGDARCRHERLSAHFIEKELTRAEFDQFTASAIARAVVAHHGYWDEAARCVANEYQAAQNELCHRLEQALGVTALPQEFPSDFNLSAFGMRLAGHIVLCDWIASGEEFFADSRLEAIDDPSEYFTQAKVVALERIEILGLKRSSAPGKASHIVESARPIQRALLNNDIPPGLVIIEAPMGEGKTEAAWILAEKWRENGYYGMYMALPTMATSDSLHRRYRDGYLKKLGHSDDVKLVHGMAWLRDEEEPEKLPVVGEPGDKEIQELAAAWFRPTRKAMLASHGVGTVDQAMLAGMHVKFGFLRLFGLADRVLVIDEVHAYDAYMSAIIVRLLQWCACMKIPVNLLSATLSAKQRSAMIEAYGATGDDPGPEAPYPLITVIEPEKQAKTIKAQASSHRTLKLETYPGLLGDAKKTAAKAVELVKDGGCCCVILNTVKQAQAVYKVLKLEDDEKLLFHARFTAADREGIAKDVLAKFGKDISHRPDRLVLVATQVVEQSLDVDFDHMISEIAPIDLLLQRSGRIKRHARNKNGEITDGPDQRGDPVLRVLLSGEKRDKNGKIKPVDFGPTEKIYQRYPLLRTLDVVTSKNEVKLPDEFRALIEATYSNDLSSDASDDLKKAKSDWDGWQEDLAAQAGQFLLCEPMADEFDPVGADEVGDDSDDGNGWRARTRLGLEDVLVIPIVNDDLNELVKEELTREKVKELYRQSVKLPAWHWPLRSPRNFNENERKKQEPVMGKSKLRGIWLLPVITTGAGWYWKGERRIMKKNGTTEWKPIAFH